MRRHDNKLLSALPAGEYFGRSDEAVKVLRHAAGAGGLRISSAPWSGASELLRHVFDRLFFEQVEIIPFYFSLRPADRTARKASVRFLQEFLSQTVAFRRRDPGIYSSSLDIGELSRLATPADAEWFERVVDGWAGDSRLNDERAFIRTCLAGPLRALASGARVFVIIDDLHNASMIDGGTALLAEMADIYSHSTATFVLSGRRGLTLDGVRMPTLSVEDLAQSRASEFTAKLAASLGVKINDQTRDLIALQTAGKPGFIHALLSTAAAKGRALDSFHSFERHYAGEMIDGRLGSFYRDAIEAAAGEPAAARILVQLLADGFAEGAPSRLEVWQSRLKISDAEFARLVAIIELAEMADVEGSIVNVDTGGHVLADYIRSRSRLENMRGAKLVVAGELLTDALKRAPRLMARLYRREASLGMADLVKTFDCQKVPLGLIDYRRFRDVYKGLAQETIVQGILAETDRITLPQIVHAAPTGEYYPPLDKIIESERSTAALGFVERKYADDGQTVWLIAEIESKIEAARDVAEFWCDRLEMAAESCGFENYTIWLIAPEGFSPEALDVIAARGGYGSSRKQIEYLRDFLNAGELVQQPRGNEYEMVIPVGDDTELIAAHAVEEIARRHNFPPRAINQIKTALVEACINAAEHGLSPDGKIYQRFSVDNEKIVITISNRGIRLADTETAPAARHAYAAAAVTGDPFEVPVTHAAPSPEGRRGWGLNLIRGLMDDVKIESVDDGTRISMTKYLPPETRAA